MITEIPRFFMGTSTENGFCGFPRDYFEADPAAHAFFIKSGPGTGKSTLLRALSAAFREQGETVEEISCSSDPDSLDGIVFPARRVCVFDATAPHVLEPKRWGLQEEIISLGDALNVSALSQKWEEITAAAERNAAAHTRARRFLSGAVALHADRETLAARALDTEKVAAIAARLAKIEFGSAKCLCPFSGEQRRFVSSVTPKGFVSYSETVAQLCPRIIALSDPYAVAAKAILRTLRAVAAQAELPRILCPDPLCPKEISHLLLPSLGVAFVTTDNRFFVKNPARTLHLKRCYDEAVLKANRNRTAFDKKGEHELLSAAVEALNDAKIAHDLLEAPYKSAMNFEKIEILKTALYQRISEFPLCV